MKTRVNNPGPENVVGDYCYEDLEVAYMAQMADGSQSDKIDNKSWQDIYPPTYLRFVSEAL